MRHVFLSLVLAPVLVLGSVQSGAAQSQETQPTRAQPRSVELSEWETATLLRLQELVEAELARRTRTGDIEALRGQVTPTSPQRRQPRQTRRRVRSQTRTTAGLSALAVGGYLMATRSRLPDSRYPDRTSPSRSMVGIVGGSSCTVDGITFDRPCSDFSGNIPGGFKPGQPRKWQSDPRFWIGAVSTAGGVLLATLFSDIEVSTDGRSVSGSLSW